MNLLLGADFIIPGNVNMAIFQPQYKYPTIQDALLRAEQQKALYEKNLVGKSFIYAYIDKNNAISYKEMKYEQKHFLHLTGLDYKNNQQRKRSGDIEAKTSALEFYSRLGLDKSLLNDVSFIQGSTSEETALFFKYTQHKLENLAQLTAISAKAEFIGKYKGNQDFDIIVNRNMSAIAFKRQQNNIHIPVSSLYGKATDVATKINPVLAIFCKENESSQYQMTFLSTKAHLDNVKFDLSLLDRIDLNAFSNPNVLFNENQRDKLITAYANSVDYSVEIDVMSLSNKRNSAFDSDIALEEYNAALNTLMDKLDTVHKGQIAVNRLKKTISDEKNELIAGEIAKIKEKFPTIAAEIDTETALASASTVKITNASYVVKDYLTQRRSIELRASGAAALAAPNPFKNFVETLRDIYQTVSKKVSEFLAPKPPQRAKPHKSSHAHDTASKPKECNSAKEVTEARTTPAKSQICEAKQYTSLSEIKKLDQKVKQEQRATPAPSKSKNKNNNIS